MDSSYTDDKGGAYPVREGATMTETDDGDYCADCGHAVDTHSMREMDSCNDCPDGKGCNLPSGATLETLRLTAVAARAAYNADPYSGALYSSRDISYALRDAVHAYYAAVAAATCDAASYDVSMGRYDWDDADLGAPSATLLTDYRRAYSSCGGHSDRDATCPDCAALDDLR